MRKVQIGLALVGMLPVSVVGLCLHNEFKLREIRSHGEVIAGIVLDGGANESAEGTMTHFLVVEFMTESMGQQVRRFLVEESDFAQASESGTIPVTYFKSDPGFSRVGAQLAPDRSLIYWSVGLLGLIIALIVAIEMQVTRRPGEKLLIQD